MDLEKSARSSARPGAEFRRIFGPKPAPPAPPAGRATRRSREVYDEAGLLYSSDTRGSPRSFPRIGGRVFRTLEIPSTLPTLDELMGRPEYPGASSCRTCVAPSTPTGSNVFTLHAEIEGMGRRASSASCLAACRSAGSNSSGMDESARELLADRKRVPVCDQVMAPIEGRSGLVASQAAA